MSALVALAFAGCVAVDPQPDWSVPYTPPPRPAAESAPALLEGPLALDVNEAIAMALEGHRGLAVARLQPAIERTAETEAAADFDPSLEAEASVDRTKAQRLARAGSGTESTIADTLNGSVSLVQRLPTGTDIALTGSVSETDSSLYTEPFASARAGLSVTQSLLRGFGRAVNLVDVQQARIDTDISQYELRGYTEALVAEVELAYWDVVLAQREIEIHVNSMQLAEQQLAQVRDAIDLGRLAEVELAAAEAELALRQEALIDARSRLAKARLLLLRLLSPRHVAPWDAPLTLVVEPPPVAPLADPIEDHVALGHAWRPELRQAELAISRGELELVRTRNGLLPRLDFFIDLGTTGYADSFVKSPSKIDGESYDTTVGIRLDMPLGNRAAEARHERAILRHDEAQEALENLRQTVELDIRTACLEVERARQQIAATAATRRSREASYEAEREKFNVGRSTSLQVAQAQRDLVSSRIAEVEARINTLKAQVTLYRQEGTLLARRGIQAPGEPVELPLAE